MIRDINPGDKIIIKSIEMIKKTLDENNCSKNGIKFYEDMYDYCDKQFWVGKKENDGFYLTPPTNKRKWDIDWIIPVKLHISIDPRNKDESIELINQICKAWKEVVT